MEAKTFFSFFQVNDYTLFTSSSKYGVDSKPIICHAHSTQSYFWKVFSFSKIFNFAERVKVLNKPRSEGMSYLVHYKLFNYGPLTLNSWKNSGEKHDSRIEVFNTELVYSYSISSNLFCIVMNFFMI